MFKIKAPETIPASVKITGQGREQTLELVFNHMERTAYQQLLDQVATGEVKAEDAVLKLIHSWKADMDLSAETIRYLSEQQPGADMAIVIAYGEALAVARKGN